MGGGSTCAEKGGGSRNCAVEAGGKARPAKAMVVVTSMAIKTGRRWFAMALFFFSAQLLSKVSWSSVPIYWSSVICSREAGSYKVTLGLEEVKLHCEEKCTGARVPGRRDSLVK